MKRTFKGQIKPKADWHAVDSPKKLMNEFVLFAFWQFTANKTNSFVCFLGESMAHPNCFWFYLTFKELVYIFWTIFWGCEPTVGRGEIRVEPPNTS